MDLKGSGAWGEEEMFTFSPLPSINQLLLFISPLQLLAISLFISGVANINNVNDGIDFVEENSIIRDFVSLPDAQLMRAASGWLIFCATIAIMYELSVIILRFLNFTVVSSNITLLIVVVSKMYTAVNNTCR